jgi:YCII-related domain
VRGGKGGEVVASDGPYAETKEALTGFYLLECADLDEAVAVAARMPAAWNGAVEVRRVIKLGPVTPTPDPAREALVRVVRDEGRRVLATLVRTVGDVGLSGTPSRTRPCAPSRRGPGTASRTARGPGRR